MLELYSSFDKLYLHIKNNALAKFVGEWQREMKEMAERGDEDDSAAIFYAFCMELLTDSNTEREIPSEAYSICRDLLHAYRKCPTEGKQFINNIMHIMHNMYPSLREEATEIFADNLGICEVAHPAYSGIILTGKDSVPEEWKREIKATCANYGAYCHATMSWLNSHVYNGSGYNYSVPEYIDVFIYADNKGTARRAAEAVNNLCFVWA